MRNAKATLKPIIANSKKKKKKRKEKKRQKANLGYGLERLIWDLREKEKK
jgi:hypothetical protein